MYQGLLGSFIPLLKIVSLQRLSYIFSTFCIRLIEVLIACLIIVHPSIVMADKYKVGLAVWSGYPDSVKGFKAGLTQGGIPKSQVQFIQGAVGGDETTQRQVAEQMKREQVDLVYSLTTPGTTIMKQAIPSHIPIVFSIVSYPADSGLIDSFEYSGNNLVGTSNYVPIRHYLTMLKMLLPETKKIAIFHREGEPNSHLQSANLARLLRRSGIEVNILRPKDLAQLQVMAEQQIAQVDLLVTTTDTLMQSGGELLLIRLAEQHRLPILSSNKVGIQQGALFGPVADFYTLGQMAGLKAAKILKQGVRPSQLATELQEPPLFLVNQTTLRALGIQLSDEIRNKVHFSR